MSKVSYMVKVGEYNDPIYVDIDLRIASGLSESDYGKLRDAFELIEDIAYHYVALQKAAPKQGDKV